MTAKIAYADVEVGTELPAQTFQVTRATLVRYAGASGDFNPIHWNEKFAKEVGLPDVIAHGMFTMAEAARVVTDWTVAAKLEDNTVRVDLTVTSAGQKVLGMSRAVVRLA
jgi:acyl dehydratase